MSKQLTIEEQIKIIQRVLYNNHDYPNKVVTKPIKQK